ncbi:hypothetical protein ASE23_26335 [Rhizobium sp. Root73]|nr:hypothetical protein ASD36_25800 [Rhizobium sp. Root1334]KRC06442.1 hypothetical protein ASE23_26335 [Rhizobium sp. Root73]
MFDGGMKHDAAAHGSPPHRSAFSYPAGKELSASGVISAPSRRRFPNRWQVHTDALGRFGRHSNAFPQGRMRMDGLADVAGVSVAMRP